MAKAILKHIESCKGYKSSSSLSDPAIAASEEDFGDLVGDDDDIFSTKIFIIVVVIATRMMIKFLTNILQILDCRGEQ